MTPARAETTNAPHSLPLHSLSYLHSNSPRPFDPLFWNESLKISLPQNYENILLASSSYVCHQIQNLSLLPGHQKVLLMGPLDKNLLLFCICLSSKPLLPVWCVFTSNTLNRGNNRPGNGPKCILIKIICYF